MATADEPESFEYRGLVRQGSDAGQVPRIAADQQSQRDADDGGPRSEQLDDRDGHQGTQGQRTGPRADL